VKLSKSLIKKLNGEFAVRFESEFGEVFYEFSKTVAFHAATLADRNPADPELLASMKLALEDMDRIQNPTKTEERIRTHIELEISHEELKANLKANFLDIRAHGENKAAS
jgi:hypothetical protein